MFQPRADLSAPCRHFGRSSSALGFFATEIPERGHSISSSFSDFDDPGRTGVLLERELLVSLGMNSVR